MKLKFLDRFEFPVLLAGLLIAAACWGFVELVEVARDAAPHAFDTQILLAFREAGNTADPLGPAWFEEAVRDITSLGGTAVLTYVTATVVFYLLVARNPGAALFVFVAVAGGQVLSSLLKLGIDRPRPDLVSHLVNVHTLSFPSGHAMLSAVTYLTLGALLARIVPGRAAKIYVLSVAVLTTLLVGRRGSISACTGRRTCWPAGAPALPGRCCAGWSPAKCWRADATGTRTQNDFRDARRLFRSTFMLETSS